MIDISALLSDSIDLKHSIRYSSKCHGAKKGVAHNRGPVVAWNITRSCNFKCKHCYSESVIETENNELTLEEIKAVIDQMKVLKVPVILLSGGEPMMHAHIFEIIEYIRASGIGVSLSTNGSLITREAAEKLKALGVNYVGISLDGIGERNDMFRGVKGAFDAAVQGIRNCNAVGQKVGLRMTVYQDNVQDVPSILEFMEQEAINRVCFYHLVPSGRGASIVDQMMGSKEARAFVELLVDYTLDLKTKGISKEILTVTNHTDGPYIYMLTQNKAPEMAEAVFQKLSNNSGNRSGMAILNMDWLGNVYPDQFSKFMLLGNVREQTLEDIWLQESEALTALRNKVDHLNSRCKGCRWLNICGGNLRARAYWTTGDLWAQDPGCYLEDVEI